MCWLEVAEYESRRSAPVDTECAPDLTGEYRWHEKTNREWGHRDVRSLPSDFLDNRLLSSQPIVVGIRRAHQSLPTKHRTT